MAQEHQIIQQIQQKLASPQLERNDMLLELASQYAELCENANERLARCIDYLDKGMRSEAVNEAQTAPNLLELFKMLRFDGAMKWYNLCADIEMTVPPPVNEEQVERLSKAVETESALLPLLREYRRSVYMGDHELSIELLRKIREKDSANPSWAVNLKPLEDEKMPQLVAETEEALRSANMRELRRLYAEFTHPQRASEPPDDIMRKLKTALLSERSSDLNREASNLMRKLQASTAEEDVPETEKLLENAAKLTADEAFIDVPGAWNAVLASAREMLDLQARRNEKKAAFLAEVDELQNNLNTGNLTEISLRHSWEHIQSWQLPVSDILKRQVEETLAEMQSRRKHRRNVTVYSIVALIIVVLVVGCVFCLHSAKAHKRNGAIAHARQLLEKGQHDELLLYVQNLGSEDAYLAATPEIADLQRQAQAAIKHREEITASYDAMYDELETIRRRGYSSSTPERIMQLMEDARNVAAELKDNGRVNRIKVWKKSYEEWNDRRIREASSEVSQCVSLIQASLSEAKNKPFANIEDEQAKIASLNARKDEVLQYLVNANEPERNAFTEVVERLQTWERNVNERADAQKKLDNEVVKLRDEIKSALPDLVKYRGLLQRYVEIAPNGDILSMDYRRLLSQFDLFMSVPALNTFTLDTMPPSEEESEKIAMLLKGPAKGTIWEKTLNTVLKLSKAEKAISTELLAIPGESPEMMSYYYIRYCKKGTEKWKRLYAPVMLTIRPSTDNPAVTVIFGKIYYQAPDGEDKIIETHTSEIFDKSFNSENYDFIYERKKEDNISEYAKFVERLVMGADGTPDMALYLLQKIEDLKNNDKLENIPKAMLFKRILGMLEKYYGEIVPEFKELSKLFNNVDVSVPWMNSESPDVIAAELVYEKVMESFPNLAQLKSIYTARCEEYRAGINAQYVCVGSIMANNGTIGINLISPVDKPLETIISSPEHKLIIVSNDRKNIINEVKGNLINGMPLFVKR